jgi:hypothetical protein
MEFPNPYQDKEGGVNPPPGVLAEQYASFVSMWLQIAGVHLLVHEHNALATLMGAFIRAFPRLKQFGVDPGTK